MAADAVTARGAATRGRLVATTAALVQRHGYQQTGLRQILVESGVSRGSLFFHFPGGKDELVAAAIIRGAADTAGLIAEATAGATSPGNAARRACEIFAQRLAASDYRDGCPVATTALEVTAGSEPLRTTCAKLFEDWLARIRVLLVAAGREVEAATALASVVLSTLEGALLLARVQRSPDALVAAGAALETLIDGVKHDL